MNGFDIAWSRRWRAIAGALLVVTPTVSSISAQQSKPAAFDRTVVPAPGKTPALRVPAWTATSLSNGARLVVSERHNLPLVSFTITFLGGANQFEPVGKDGVASFTAAMLSEGTTTKSGDELSNALQLLGTSVGAGVGGESGSIGFVSTTAKFPEVLAILEDMLVNPLLPADALERLRARTLVSLTQAKDQTGAIAGRVFPKVLYTDEHPYGRAITEKTVKAITREDVVAFHKAYFTPGRALITVVGDVEPAAVRRTVERVLAPWPAGGSTPSFAYPAVKPPAATTIYLVDKPDAAQSSFALGIPGPPRDTPDFMALQLLNTILGGQFQSRLNANLREQKGYSYSVSSGFAYGKGPGPFEAGGDIVTAKTDSALIEFMKELRGIQGARPITDEELQTAKELLVQRLPQSFGSVSAVNGSITNIYVNGLPQDYYQRYADRVAAVTREDLVRVAKKYIDVDHLAIVIVGDRKEIEEPLRKTGIAPIVLLDLEGDPIK
jgi:predicted Zn-dependent peptidase